MSSLRAPSLHVSLATKEELMRFHDAVRIEGYCKACDKHGSVWSCPPFGSPPLESYPEWTHVVLLCHKCPVRQETTQAQLMELFHSARAAFNIRIRELESRQPGATALVAGQCSGCEPCSRLEGLPCRFPEQMRHSLEAIGFDVTQLSESLVGQKLHWPKSGMPEYLMTVGALLCPDKTSAEALCRAASAN